MTSEFPHRSQDRWWLLTAAAFVVVGALGAVSIWLPVWLYPERPPTANLGTGVLLAFCYLFVVLGSTALVVLSTLRWWARHRD